MSEQVPAMVCVGEMVQFDGSGSYAAPGYTLTQYTWDFADGTTALGANVSHSFAEPGEYVVQLNLLDDNNCVNSNLVDLQVLVSTTPTFTGTIQSLETCLGAIVDLDAVVTPTTWTGQPVNNFGPPVQLPDDQGIPFSSEIIFTQFSPGQTLLNTNDLISVCASMEHTFIGDLVISLACPNGQSVTFHQQNGGGTDLGQPGAGSAWNLLGILLEPHRYQWYLGTERWWSNLALWYVPKLELDGWIPGLPTQWDVDLHGRRPLGS